MSIAFLTPYVPGTAELANAGRWRHKLLPVGEVAYKGRTLKFTRDYLADLVRAFDARAYDQVPFQLADAGNSHTNDPERTRGLITGMELRGDGLWVELEPTAAGNAVITANPGLGVSARIVEDYDRSDGKFFPRAIQHVLGTLDPRIPGLGGWEAVEASNDAEVTIDLSDEQFRREPGMPELTEDQRAKLGKLLDLDPDKLSALINVDPAAVAAAAGAEPPGDDEDAEIQAIADQIDGMTDAELLELEAELDAEEAAEQQQQQLQQQLQQQPEPAGVAGAGLSTDAAMAIELANAQGAENARQLAVITAQLDAERWQGEKRRLVASGTPPYIADLAQPLLEGAGHVVDLANGKSVDAGQVIRSILTEYQKLGAQLGLGVELGTEMDEPPGQAETDRDEIVKRAKAQLFGIR